MDLLRERFGISIKSNLPRLRSGRKKSRNNECKCKAYEELINDIYEDDFRLLDIARLDCVRQKEQTRVFDFFKRKVGACL